jgi:hypothetical protein
MSENRETEIWKVLDRLTIGASIFAIVFLTLVYFVIADVEIQNDGFWAIARNFGLDVIANLIPTFVLIAGSYILFRRIQYIKSEHETNELAAKLSSKLMDNLNVNISSSNSSDATLADPISEESEEDKFKRKVKNVFEITDKYFDDTSSPQKIVVKLTNKSLRNIISVQKVKHYYMSFGLPETALLSSYKKEDDTRDVIIPFDNNKSEVLPGQIFEIELGLAQKWEREKINSMSGTWGYLRLEILFNNRNIELSYTI